jgi:hypothetical protein
MEDRRNGVDQAYARISDPDHPEHSLGFNDIGVTVVQTVIVGFPSRSQNLTVHDFPRVFLHVCHAVELRIACSQTCHDRSTAIARRERASA